MNIFDEVKKLNFPLGQYVVVGSGIMHVLGIKTTEDIDIVLKPELFEKLRKEEWDSHPRPNGEPGLEKGIVEVYLNVNCGECNPTIEELLDEAVVIQGVPFIPLKRLVCFKKAYGRAKDAGHIALIEKYIHENPNGLGI